jgi:CRP/FNR family transcriptional regulator, cyclic AMP receptor protein
MPTENSTNQEVPAPIGFSLQRPLLPALSGFTRLGSASNFEDEIFELIDRIALFEDLGRAEASKLCAAMECFGVPRGEAIMKEGEEGEYLVIVLTGEVAVLKQDATGNPIKIADVGPGASLGEMSLINGQPRFATCIAQEPTDIAVLTRDSIYDILVLQPSLGNKILLILLQNVSQRLRETSARLVPFLNPEKQG